jgi:Ion channel
MNLFGFNLTINTPGVTSLSFDLALYYMVVTCTTVGYGDISPEPNSLFAKAFIGLFIMLTIVIISKQTSELTALLQVSQTIKRIK